MSKVWQRKTIITILFVTLLATAVLPALGHPLVQHTASASSGIGESAIGSPAEYSAQSANLSVSHSKQGTIRDMGANGYPGTTSFASTAIGHYNIKWLRVNQPYPSYLISDHYNLVVQLNYCSDSSTLAAATQCYQNAVKSNPGVHTWEVFNEPTDPSYQGGFQNGSPYNVYLLTKAAFQVIKAHNPTDVVLAPSVSIYTYVSGNSISPWTYNWMTQYWSYGAANYVSYVSLHEYSQGLLYNQVPSGATETVSQIIGAGLNKYEALVHKPIWITETGCNIQDQSTLAACLTQDYTMLFSKSYVQGIFWYELSDFSYSGGSTTYWGLFDSSNNPKTPVLAAYESFNAKAQPLQAQPVQAQPVQTQPVQAPVTATILSTTFAPERYAYL